jgi:hypothetical protein
MHGRPVPTACQARRHALAGEWRRRAYCDLSCGATRTDRSCNRALQSMRRKGSSLAAKRFCRSSFIRLSSLQSSPIVEASKNVASPARGASAYSRNVLTNVGSLRSELERDEHLTRGAEPPRALGADLVDERSTDQGGQELVEHGPLIMPLRLPDGGLEHAVLRSSGSPRVVDERVVRHDHRQVHLRDQHVRVVPRIADDRDSFGVAADRVQERLVGLERRQLRQHATVDGGPDRGVDRRTSSRRRKAMGSRGRGRSRHIGATVMQRSVAMNEDLA